MLIQKPLNKHKNLLNYKVLHNQHIHHIPKINEDLINHPNY